LEAKAASALNHPNIVTIYAIGEAQGVWFIAAELIEGRTLRDRMSIGKTPLREVADIGIQCAAALSRAHQAGVVHRDIKPENIMLRPDGVAKVVDFGLARMVEARPEWSPQATQTGSVMGTPRYMSPEQARGRKPDARSDIFSLGVVLFEMAAGHPAFPGTTTAEVFAALLGPELDVSEAGALGDVIARALAKDPEARYQTMEELGSGLRNFDAAETRVKPARRTQGSTFRKRAGIVAAAISLAALLSLTGYKWMTRDAPGNTTLKVVPLATFAGPKGYPALSPDGARIAFSWQPPGDTAAHIYVKPAGDGDPAQLTSAAVEDVSPAWSPDGSTIAFCRQKVGEQVDGPRDIYLVPASGGGERKVAEGWRGVSWSPDGKTLALTHVPNEAKTPAQQTGGVFVLSLETGRSRELTEANRDSFPLFSPDGKWVAFKRLFSGSPAQIFVIPVEGGSPKQLTFDPLQPIRAATWTSDSREIVFASLRSGADGSLWRVPIRGGAPRPVSAMLRDASDPSISRQGRLAYREEWIDSNLYLRTAGEVRDGVPGGFGAPVSVAASSREDHSPAFSPDGERIAFTSERSGSLEIWVARRDGSQAVALTSLRAQNTGSPRWSPDGRRILFDSWASGASAIYMVDAAGGLPRALTKGPLGSWMADWSPDGQWIYFSRGLSGASDIWRMPAEGGDATQVTHSGAFESRPSPDGKLVYYSKQGPGGGRSLWSVPAEGGVEKPVPELEQFQSIGRGWGVIESGIYFVSHEDSAQQAVRFLSLRTRKVSPLLFPLQRQIRWGVGTLAFSRDGRYAVGTELDHSVNDLMMIENFR
jgi:Tol biopolymer transport system component